MRSLANGEPLESVLCLGAHSDDIEIGAGGTILRLLREHPALRVTWVVMSGRGARGDEARKSAEAMCGSDRVDVVTHELRDGFLPASWSEVKELVECQARAVRPDVVLTHTRADLHQDHRLLAELAWNTFRDHPILEFEIPKWDGDLHTPNLYVPLTRADADRKVELLMTHFATQANKDWFTPDTFLGLMRLRGIECRAPEGYAEGFHARKLVW